MLTEAMRCLHHIEALSEMCHCPFMGIRDAKVLIIPNVPETCMNNPFTCDPEMLSAIPEMAPERPFIFQDPDFPDIFYGAIRYKEKDRLSVIGPVAKKKLPVNILSRYIKKHQIKDEKNFFIHQVPVITVCHFLSEIYMMSFDVYIDPKALLPVDKGKKDVNREPDEVNLEFNLSYDTEEKIHFPYRNEEKMLDMIRNGDINFEFAENSLKLHEQGGKLAHSEIKDREYKSVGAITLYCRAAIQGGLNPYESFEIGEMYLQKISEANKVGQYNNIREACFRHYCRSVYNAQSARNENLHVQRCKYFIDKNVTKKFSFDDLVQYVGIDQSYLSKLFRHVEGETITEYITRSRIKAAENMLKFSRYTTQEISDYLSFYDQSYFCKVFKSKVGLTPTEYRKKYKNQNF